MIYMSPICLLECGVSHNFFFNSNLHKVRLYRRRDDRANPSVVPDPATPPTRLGPETLRCPPRKTISPHTWRRSRFKSPASLPQLKQTCVVLSDFFSGKTNGTCRIVALLVFSTTRHVIFPDHWIWSCLGPVS